MRRILRKRRFPSRITCFVPNQPPMNIPIPKQMVSKIRYCPRTMIAAKLPINQKTDIAVASHFAISAGSLMTKVLLK